MRLAAVFAAGAVAGVMSVACAPLAPSEEDDSTSGSDDADDSSECPGADLQTDAMNCGSCGNECAFDPLDPSVGGCAAGECAPLWSECHLAESSTCSEVCGEASLTCVEGGCAGATWQTTNNLTNCQAATGGSNAGPCGALLQTGTYVRCCCG
jgi:hypothetical protein